MRSLSKVLLSVALVSLSSAAAAATVSPVTASLGPQIALPSQVPPEVALSGSVVAAASDGSDFLIISFVRGGMFSSAVSAGGAPPTSPGNFLRYSQGVDGVTLTWTGSSYLLTWVLHEGGFPHRTDTLWSATLDRTGTLLFAQAVAPTLTGSSVATASFNGANLFLLCRHGQFSYGQAQAFLLDGNGRLVEPTIAFESTMDRAQVSTDGSDFYVFWQEVAANTSGVTTLASSRFSGSGVRLAPPSTFSTIAANGVTLMGVAFDGSKFALTVFLDRGEAMHFVQRILITPGSMGIETLTVPALSDPPFQAFMFFDGVRFVTVWTATDLQHANVRLWTLRFSSTVPKRRRIPTPVEVRTADLSPSALQGLEVAAINGTGRLLVAAHLPGRSSTDMALAFVETNDRIDRREFVPFGSGPAPLPAQTGPQLTSAGDESLLVWVEQGDLLGWRIDQSGVPIEVAPFLIRGVSLSTPGFTIVPIGTVFIDGSFSVIWKEVAPDFSTGGQIYLQRVDKNAGVIGEPRPIAYATKNPASLASNGSNILIVDGGNPVRVSATGELLDNAPIRVPVYGGSVASNGLDYIVVGITRLKNPDEHYAVFAARIGGNGSILDSTPIPIATAHLNYDAVQVASDGRDYVITYHGTSAQRGGLRAKKLLSVGALASTSPDDDGLLISMGGSSPVTIHRPFGYVIGFTNGETDAAGSFAFRLKLVTLDDAVSQVQPLLSVPVDSSRPGFAFPSFEAMTALDSGSIEFAYADAYRNSEPRLFLRLLSLHSP